MYHYSTRSRQRLATCHPKLQAVFNEVIRHRDCSILEGHRAKALQNHYFKQGKSKLKWPASRHNQKPSLAVDAVPYPVDWLDTERMAHFAGFVLGIGAQQGVILRWGGDWDKDGEISDHRFIDYPHFELVNP